MKPNHTSSKVPKISPSSWTFHGCSMTTPRFHDREILKWSKSCLLNCLQVLKLTVVSILVESPETTNHINIPQTYQEFTEVFSKVRASGMCSPYCAVNQPPTRHFTSTLPHTSTVSIWPEKWWKIMCKKLCNEGIYGHPPHPHCQASSLWRRKEGVC